MENWIPTFLSIGAYGLVSLIVVGVLFAILGYVQIRKHDANWEKIYSELDSRYSSIDKLVNVRKHPPPIPHSENKKRESGTQTDPQAPLQSEQNGPQQPEIKLEDHPPGESDAKTSVHPVNTRMLLIDIIVEKAQRKLSERSASYFLSGTFLFVISGTMVLMLATFLFYNTELSYSISYELLSKTQTFTDCTQKVIANPAAFTKKAEVDSVEAVIPNMVCYEMLKTELRPFPNSYPHAEWFVFIIELFKRITAGGVVIGMAYIIAATANSCFRESTILLHRRHLLRYIRLMSYEKDGEIERKDLRDIFGVDQATRTGFDNVKTESLKDNLVSKLIEAIGRIGSNVKASEITINEDRKK